MKKLEPIKTITKLWDAGWLKIKRFLSKKLNFLELNGHDHQQLQVRLAILEFWMDQIEISTDHLQHKK